MRSREAGFAAGILAIFRELNMIAATPFTEVSNSKMLMTDSLTGLGLGLFCLIVVRWFRKPDPRPLRALLIGGFLGLFLLLRSQSLLLIPAALILLFLQRRPDWRGFTREAIFFTVGVALAVSPWIIRNGVRTGDYALDQPSQAGNIARHFSSSIEEGDNLVLSSNSNQVSAYIIRYTVTHPGEVLNFITAHFLNNELSTFSVLPLQASFDDYQNNIKINSLFWLDGVKAIAGNRWVLFGLNLILISIGLGSAAKRWGWAGMVPLVFHLVYSLSSAVVRFSGWRFIQPVDWIGFFYFCLGFSEIIIWFFAASNLSLHPREKNTRERPLAKPGIALFGIASASILIAGMILPLAEWVVPLRYNVAVQESAQQIVYTSETARSAIGSMEGFMMQPSAVKLIGRALYPRWYKAGGGEPGNGWAAYKAREQAFLGFMMVGPGGDQQLVLYQNTPPADFAHASDVIIFGCKKENFIDVRLVVGYNQPNLFAYRADSLSPFCE
jgi:hypothetical protein